MPNQAQHNMDNINIGGWVDKSKGINYESVNMAQGEMEARRHVRRWKCRTDTNLKYRLQERREKRGYYRHFAFQSRQRSKE